jgi:hypothetical protein
MVEKIRSAVHILQDFSNTGRVLPNFFYGAFRKSPLAAIASLTAVRVTVLVTTKDRQDKEWRPDDLPIERLVSSSALIFVLFVVDSQLALQLCQTPKQPHGRAGFIAKMQRTPWDKRPCVLRIRCVFRVLALIQDLRGWEGTQRERLIR